jgi:hypothetical protein
VSSFLFLLQFPVLHTYSFFFPFFFFWYQIRWAERLASLGVDIKLKSLVRGLKFEGSRIVGEMGGSSYDHYVLALDLPGLKGVLRTSQAADEQAAQKLTSLKDRILQLKIAPLYKVGREITLFFCGGERKEENARIHLVCLGLFDKD